MKLVYFRLGWVGLCCVTLGYIRLVYFRLGLDRLC
jgi:hypothetical protein